MMASSGVKSYNHTYPTNVKVESYTNSDEFELIECEKDMRGRDLKEKIIESFDIDTTYNVLVLYLKENPSGTRYYRLLSDAVRINSVLKWVREACNIAPFSFSDFVPFVVVLRGALEPSVKIRVFEFSLEHLQQKIKKTLDLSGNYKIYAVEIQNSTSASVELIDEDNVKDICRNFSNYRLEISRDLLVASKLKTSVDSKPDKQQVIIGSQNDDEYDVMISYSWHTKDQVDDLYNALLEAFPGIKIWIDRERMKTDIFDGMTEGIVCSNAIIVCLSAPYLKSVNCQREIKFAGDLNRPLIPAYMFGPNDKVTEFREDKKLGVPFLLTAGALYADFKSQRAGSPEWNRAFQVITGQIQAKVPRLRRIATELSQELPNIANETVEAHSFKPSVVNSLEVWLNPVDFRSTVEYFHGAFVDGTCKQLFDIVLEWALSDDESLIMWVNSGHGTGKSFFAWYLSYHLPDHLFIRGIYFFCSHDDYRRNEPASIVRTLAWMLSEQLPAIKNHIETEMKTDTAQLGAGNSSILVNAYKSFEVLIVEGFKTCEDPNRIVLIVIDGLDECNPKTRNILLQVFGDLIPMLPKFVKFVITSRPEKDIFDALENTEMFELPPNRRSESATPIALTTSVFDYARDTVMNVKIFLEKQCLDLWGEGGTLVVDTLETKMSEKGGSGFLVLQVLFNHLSNQNVTVDKAREILESSAFHIDDIYTMLLVVADVETNVLKRVLGVLFFAYQPVDIKTLYHLSDLPLRDVLCCLEKIRSLLVFKDGKVLIMHKSFKEYCTNPERCPSAYYISQSEVTRLLSQSCFNVLATSYDTHKKIDLCSPAVTYAALHWSQHVTFNNLPPNFEDFTFKYGQILILLAKQGDVNAQQRLGSMYLNGVGMKKNLATAMHYFRLAANQGLAAAQFKVGAMYHYGIGAPKLKVTAFEWYKKAAAQGDLSAQSIVASQVPTELPEIPVPAVALEEESLAIIKPEKGPESQIPWFGRKLLDTNSSQSSKKDLFNTSDKIRVPYYMSGIGAASGSDAGSRYETSVEVSNWSVDEVALWADRTVRAPRHAIDKFIEYEIDGGVLLTLSTDDLYEMEIKEEALRKWIIGHIDMLRAL
ncbi:hypothetical protein BCR33DRAFT_765973 [Rhizoclosmatium globosum]|uniref:SAM domain-containing protein n=1 Tax=Rhizoclosmatium globosum TaxID=329046 RepID=A0A1Y2CDE0_9FUNG|nr:hypothetical protein BCR33DRAFT_765973 [Rhizoclosmatium globosum]|eukprot:ORY44325.1 hypothetical protein BCR33DRAFT_765973 [Rhizoclosmatium globosum]